MINLSPVKMPRTGSCDTFVALPPVTANGCVVFGKNSDRPDDEVQEVVFFPAAEHGAGTQLQVRFLGNMEETSLVIICIGIIPYIRRYLEVYQYRHDWIIKNTNNLKIYKMVRQVSAKGNIKYKIENRKNMYTYYVDLEVVLKCTRNRQCDAFIFQLWISHAGIVETFCVEWI